MSVPVIELDRVERTYEGTVPVQALHPTSLKIDWGVFAAIVGPSGSGKSTLLGLLGLLDRPTAGSIRVVGRDPATLGERSRTAIRAEFIGFVFQQFHLISHLSAVENVEMALANRGLSKRMRRRRALESLDRVRLGHRSLHLPKELSGGEQQRTALARALVTDPDLILADEPTGALDSASAERVMSILTEVVREGRALVVVTHDREMADAADRRITLRDGRVVSDEGVGSQAAAELVGAGR